MLTVTDILFYVFAVCAVASALMVIVLSNPIYSALFLALTMSVLGAIFFILDAYFISAAQIIVYAGAVMVLFVMVVMLFDLKGDQEEVFKISPLNTVKLLSAALLCGFLIGTGWLAVTTIQTVAAPTVTTTATGAVDQAHSSNDEDLTNAEKDSLVEPENLTSTTNLSKLLFTRYVFAFEAVSLLLLIAIVGSVALARSKGGTHHVAR